MRVPEPARAPADVPERSPETLRVGEEEGGAAVERVPPPEEDRGADAVVRPPEEEPRDGEEYEPPPEEPRGEEEDELPPDEPDEPLETDDPPLEDAELPLDDAELPLAPSRETAPPPLGPSAPTGKERTRRREATERLGRVPTRR